jgi:hydroxymethylbilane synthase
MFYAVGQGAIAVQCRANDTRMLNLLSSIDHLATRLRCECERALLRRLEGGCSVPIGVSTNFSDQGDGDLLLHLTAVVCSLDGSEWIQQQHSQHVTRAADAESLGDHVAELLLAAGCKRVLDACKSPTMPTEPADKTDGS